MTPSQKCTMCGEEKKMNTTNFYKSFSPLFKGNYENRMCICKKCLLEYTEKLKETYKSENKALYEICRLVDTYYSKTLYDQLNEESTKKKINNIFATYFQKVNSLHQYKDKTFIDSEPYETDFSYLDDTEDKINSTDLVAFWGEGYTEDEYRFLTNEYENLTTRYECDSYSQEILFQDIAFQRLAIRKKRQSGGSVDKELKTLQDLLGSANIKPAQENESMASEQVTFGTLIKKFENEKPIPPPLPEWMSANWIKKYVCVWFFGNLCEMMGKSNPFKDEYDEEISKYTVKRPGEDEEGEE